MKGTICLWFLPFISCISLNASGNSGIFMKWGYSINTDIANELRILEPTFNDSYPFSMGGFLDYTYNRLTLSTELCLEYSKYRITYNEMDESGFITESHKLSNITGLMEDYHSLACKVPIGIQYRIVGGVSIGGSLGIEYQPNRKIRKKINPFWSMGLCYDHKRTRWSVYISEPIQEKSFELPENPLTKFHPGIGALHKSRVVGFALYYSMWSH